MNATSSPSSSVDLNAITRLYRSRPAARPIASRRGDLRREGCVLVVLRLEPARAKNRLAEPLEPEDEQERADDEPQHVDRHRLERGPERGDEHHEDDERRDGALQRRAPAAGDAEREHDRERLHHLDRARERGAEEDEQVAGHPATVAFRGDSSAARRRGEETT